MSTTDSRSAFSDERADIHQLLRARVVAACAISAAHVALIYLLMRPGVELHTREIVAEPMLAEIIAEIAGETPSADLLSVPTQPIDLALPTVNIDIERDASAIEAPKLDAGTSLDISAYASRAELAPGTVATVILLLEIAPDGSVIWAQVLRSTAGEAANSAAIDYARATRWTAGTIDGEPRAMQASLAVVLGERG